ncbi:MAG: O-antigen ligase family protein [Bacteroidetes bacterium]|nr:O-antigen ligase family protein [Bacteroidota bacterium]
MRTAFDVSEIPKLFFGSLILVCITIPFSIQINSALIALTLSLGIAYYIISKKRKLSLGVHGSTFLVLYFASFIGFLNSRNTEPVAFDIEQKLSLLVIPLIYALGPALEKGKVKFLQLSFAIATLAVCLHGFRNGFYLGYQGEELYNNLIINHPYLGIYCVSSLIFLMAIVPEEQYAWRRILIWSLIVFFVLYLGILFAKMSIVVFFVLSFLYLLWHLYNRKRLKLITFILILTITSTAYLIYVNPMGRDITKRILQFKQFDWNQYDPVIVNSLNLRFIKWTCSAEILKRENNWIFGAGTGDVQGLLNACYKERINKDTFLAASNYNSHNEYFTYWLNLGIVGLFAFGFHFIMLMRMHIARNDIAGILFTLGILLFCITESVFETQKGIVFYAYFQSLYIFRMDGPTPSIKI